MITNPFYYASELKNPNDIIGRDEEAIEMAQWLKSGNNIRLLGPRRIGKSSFINKLSHELQKDTNGIWRLIKIDLNNSFSLIAVLRSIIEAINSSDLPSSIKKKVKQQLMVIEKTSGLNVALQSIGISSSTKQIITPDETEELIKRCLIMLSKTIPNLVVAFDEFQNLLFLPDNQSYQILSIIRTSLMSDSTQNSSVLVTGSIKRSMDILLSEPSSPLLHQLEHFSLTRIHRVDWINFLNYMFEATNKSIEDDFVELIIQKTKGHSLRTQQLSANVWRMSEKTITFSDIENSWHKMLEDYYYEFENRISELIANTEINLVRFLYALNENGWKNLTSKMILQTYGFANKDAITRSKEKAIKLGLIEQINKEYIISDPLFESYLSHKPMIKTV